MRRVAFIIVLLLVGVMAGQSSAVPGARPGEIAFTVLRERTPIGNHSVTVTTREDSVVAEINIDLQVRFAFVTLYRYRHQSREVWRDGRLLQLDASTDDNGERWQVRAAATAAGLAVEGSSGSFLAPADTRPTSYWRRELVAHARLLDTQTGRLLEVTAQRIGAREAAGPGSGGEAEWWRLSGDLSALVAYTPEGDWVGLEFEARGSTIVYRR